MSTSSIGEGVSTSADVKPPIPEPIQSAAGGDKKKKCCKLHVMCLYPVNVIRGFHVFNRSMLEIVQELVADACSEVCLKEGWRDTSVLACVCLFSGLKTFRHEILWDTTPWYIEKE
jgi:hypothetical protein